MKVDCVGRTFLSDNLISELPVSKSAHAARSDTNVRPNTNLCASPWPRRQIADLRQDARHLHAIQRRDERHHLGDERVLH